MLEVKILRRRYNLKFLSEVVALVCACASVCLSVCFDSPLLMQCVSGPGPDGHGEKGLLPVSALPAVLPRHPRGCHLRLPQGLHQVRLPRLSASFTDSQLLVVTWTSGNFALGPAARRTTSWTESPWSLTVFLSWRPCWPRGVAKPPCKTDSAPPLYKENTQMFQREVAPPSGLEWKPTGKRRARPHRD